MEKISNLTYPLDGREVVGTTGGGFLKANHQCYAPYIKEFARKMRKEMTDEEFIMWQQLKQQQLGFKFRRQFAIDSKYIADFVCLEKRLIIEIDGGQHCGNLNDKNRTLYLENLNFRIIRFWNSDIYENLDGCVEIILNELKEPLPDFSAKNAALPQGEGLSSLTSTHAGEVVSTETGGGSITNNNIN
jgi:very-short-patch-repair endonuclease